MEGYQMWAELSLVTVEKEPKPHYNTQSSQINLPTPQNNWHQIKISKCQSAKLSTSTCDTLNYTVQ